MDDSIRVLHVDDDQSWLDLSRSMFNHAGDHLSITSELSAADGLAQLLDDDTTIDCVISDYDMPQMNGLEFLVAVRGEFPDLPFILLTGKGSEEIASRAISAGVTDYHKKSGKPDQFVLLTNRIDHYITRARAQARLEQAERELMFWKEYAPAIVVVEPEGTIITASGMSREVFHTKQPDELVGMDIRELVHPTERDELEQVIQQLQEEKEEVVCHNRTLIDLSGGQTQTTVQWRTIKHWGTQALLAVMNDFPSDQRIGSVS